MKKIILLMLFVTLSVTGQVKNDWQVGLGFGITAFGDEGALAMGDQYLFQVPRLNITAPIYNNFSLDLATSFNTVNDISLIKNSINYLSLDASVRYNFHEVLDGVNPYLFVGGSLVDSDLKMTPTMNIGAGAVFWFAKNWGLNGQFYYKHSLEIYESMRSHMQYTVGVIYSFDANNIFGGRGARRCP